MSHPAEKFVRRWPDQAANRDANVIESAAAALIVAREMEARGLQVIGIDSGLGQASVQLRNNRATAALVARGAAVEQSIQRVSNLLEKVTWVLWDKPRGVRVAWEEERP